MYRYEDYQHLIWYAIRPFRSTITKTKMVYAMTIDDLYQIASIRLWMTISKIKNHFHPKQINRYLIRSMYLACLSHLKRQREPDHLPLQIDPVDVTAHLSILSAIFSPLEKKIFDGLRKKMTLTEMANAFQLSYMKVYRIKETIKSIVQSYLQTNVLSYV